MCVCMCICDARTVAALEVKEYTGTQGRGQVSPYMSSVLWISAIRRSNFSECLGKNWNLEL